MAASKSPRALAFEGLKKLAGAKPSAQLTPNQLWHFDWRAMAEHDPRDDRAVAIMSVTALEQALEKALLTKFVPLDASEANELFSSEAGSLSDLHSKTQVAFAIGLIGKRTKEDFVCIRKVRNIFAHSRLPLTFDTPEIAAVCVLLNLRTEQGHKEARRVWISTVVEYTYRLIIYPAGKNKAGLPVGPLD